MANENTISRIIQLEEVCVSLEEAQALNNKENAAHAWVYNPHKHTPEFELLPVDSFVGINIGETEQVIGVKITTGKWKLYNADIFVAVEQINQLIENQIFYFAPFKK